MPLKLAEFTRNCGANSPLLHAPVLVWETPGEISGLPVGPAAREAKSRRRSPTIDIPDMSRDEPPPRIEPMVYSLIKGLSPLNPFAMGVTIGRIDTNDVVIDHDTVSRFHAWFTKENTGWIVVDAESLHGTWVDGRRLVANARTRLTDRSTVRIGQVSLVFLEVATLLDRARKGLLLGR